MQISIRSKLIIGYTILVTSLVVVAISGYTSFIQVLDGRKTVRFYSNMAELSNDIYQHMTDAKEAQNRFLVEANSVFAITVLKQINKLQKDTKRFEQLAIRSRNSYHIETAQAIVDSATVYLETFNALKGAIVRRGQDHKSGLRGSLRLLQQSLAQEISEVDLMKIRILEMEYLQFTAGSELESLVQKMISHLEGLIHNATEPSQLDALKEYRQTFQRLAFEDLNIRDLMPLIRLNEETIEMFVEDNLRVAKANMEEQLAITEMIAEQQKWILLIISTTAIFVGLFSLMILGSEPLMLSRLIQEQAAMLEAIRDGLLAVNRRGIITLLNHKAKEILNLKEDYVGKHISEVLPGSPLPYVMETGKPEFDQEHRVGNVTIITTRIPVRLHGDIIGGIASFREKGELANLAGKLTQVNGYIDALRASNHEFKNHLQTIQGMIQLDHIQEVLKYIHSLQTSQQQRLSLYVDHIKDPAISAILLGKYNRAHEMGISLYLDESSKLSPLPKGMDTNAIVSILGNLIENAMDAVLSNGLGKKKIWITIKELERLIFISVRDNGPGIPPAIAQKIFKQGFSTKAGKKSTSTFNLGSSDRHMGMGLYITHNHIIGLGGNIQFKSDQGTTFEVGIPKLPPTTGPQP